MTTSRVFSQSLSLDDYLSPGITITSVIQGVTILANHYTTVTLSPAVTSNANSKLDKNDNHGLSEKNKKIVLGCCLGVGIPLLLLILFLIYYLFIRQKKESYINSDGQVVTAYKINPLLQLWNQIIGKRSDTNIITTGLSNTNNSNNKNNNNNNNKNSKRRHSVTSRNNLNTTKRLYHHLGNSPLGLNDEFENDGDFDDTDEYDDGAFELSISDSSNNNNCSSNNDLNEKRNSSNSEPQNNNTVFSNEVLPENTYTSFIERFNNGSSSGSDNIYTSNNSNSDSYYVEEGGEDDDENGDDDDHSSHRVLNVTNL